MTTRHLPRLVASLARRSAPAIGILLRFAAPAAGQAVDSPPPIIIDGVDIITENVFSEEEIRKNALFRVMNGIRFQTRRRVVEKELLFEPGSALDSVQLAETERNLRQLGLFRFVSVDTVTRHDSLIVKVRTQDAWSTQPIFRFSLSGETLTGRIGLSEKNLVGSGNTARVVWSKDVDRNAFEVDSRFRRVFGTQLDVAGMYSGLSDGNIGKWSAGDPWRSADDPRAAGIAGDVSNRRIPQYMVLSETVTDTTQYRYRGFGSSVFFGIAPLATSGRFTRIGVEGTIRNDRYLSEFDTAAVLAPPDSVKGWIGGVVETRHDRFAVFQYLNGFSLEDVNLSPYATGAVRLAPSAFGYDRDGVGLAGSAGTGIRTGPVFLRIDLAANALFTSAGIDSGRVVLNINAAAKPGLRHAVLLGFVGGLLDNPPPGSEFDFGYDRAPRSFDPHSFVGTRGAVGTIEYRWYVWDSLLGLFGLGFAGFLDYGGAWYADQDPRSGGDIGVGLRTGSARGSGAQTGRIDIGYRFGPGVTGNRWTFSLGTGFSFF